MLILQGLTWLLKGLPRVILVEDLCKPIEIEGNAVHIHQIRVSPSWMDSIVLFHKEDILPEEKLEADKVWRKAYRFWLSEDQKLYKRSFSRPYLLCIHPEVVEVLLEELHKGICGSHTRADLYLIGPLLKAIGGQICRRKHKSMWKSVTNAKNLRPTFTNKEVSLILHPAFGLLPNGAWTL